MAIHSQIQPPQIRSQQRRFFRTTMAFLLIFGILFRAPDMAVYGADTGSQADSAPPPAFPPPSLSQVVYRVGSLSQQLSTLKSNLLKIEDSKSLDETLFGMETRIQSAKKELKAISAEDLRSYQRLAQLKKELRTLSETIAAATASMGRDIQSIETARKTWSAEKNQWDQWKIPLADDFSLEEVTKAFSRAETNIAEAHALLSEKLEPLLAVHQKTGYIQARIDALQTQIDDMMSKRRGDRLRSDTPPLFFPAYIRQLIDLYSAPETLFNPLPLPEPQFYAEKGWVFFLQIAVFVILLTLLRRYRPTLLGHPARRFLGVRSVSVALLVPIFTLTFLYDTPPTLWQMLFQTLAGVTIARLTTAFVKEEWITQAITILVVILISFQTLLALGIPTAVMRLFVLVSCVAGTIYYSRRLWIEKRQESASTWRSWMLRCIILVFGAIAVTDLIGLSGFSIHLLESGIGTAILMIMGWVMIRLIRIMLEMGVEQIPMGGLDFLRNSANAIVSRIVWTAKAGIVFFVAINLLVTWNLYALPSEAAASILAFGFTIGGERITVGLMLMAAIILYSAFALSWLVQRVLMDRVLAKTHMDTGARLSIAHLAHYTVILVGFLITLSAMGFELRNITIIGGALGVGVGFGMQTLVNNFVSGLILLFERPIKVGDIIELGGGQTGRVTKMGLRATTVQTFDKAEVVVPNGNLLSTQLINWTLEDRSMRLSIAVRVAYGSDVEAVIRILCKIAADNHNVLKTPAPSVAFINFGTSALDFQLRVFISDFNDSVSVKTALMLEIDKRFRELAIEIPFPQQDVHVRDMNDDAIAQLKKQIPTFEKTGDS